MDWLGLEGKELRTATVADLQAFSDSIEGRPATVARTLSAIKSLLSFGQRTGYLRWNIGAAVKLPPIPSRIAERILTEAQVHKLIALETN